MKLSILFTVTLSVLLLCFPPAVAAGGPAGVKAHYSSSKASFKVIRTTGKRYRKLKRLERWVESLSPDQRSVYRAHGAPTYRLFEAALGIRLERWIYPRLETSFVFQSGKYLRGEPYRVGF